MDENGILRLNDCDAERNPAAWSHDPSMMWDPVSGRYYSYSTDVYRPEAGLDSRIGIPVRSSADLVHFQYEGTVLSEAAVREGRDNGAYPDTKGFWAPYTEYVHGEYRMYYSATRAFGSSESRIWLAVSDSPLGPFENRGVVADTWGTDDTDPNAIDAHVIWQEERSWLVYGSFFGGIYLKELDSRSGLAKSGDPRELGVCISRARRGTLPDGPEGAAVMYCPEEDWYYLFQSYGWLGDGYDIRVGRSRSVCGPYCDMEGKSLVEESRGVKLAGSYCFRADSPRVLTGDGGWKQGWKWGGLRGPGHGVPFFDPVSRRWFFVHHIRDGALVNKIHDEKEGRDSYQIHYMMVRPMFFQNGWPVLSPEPYQGEIPEPVSPMEAEGQWELIVFDEADNQMKTAVSLRLTADSEYLKNGVIFRSRDFENGGETLCVCGFRNSGLAYWGKFLYNIV